MSNIEEHKRDARQSVSKFLRNETVYDMLPNSGQVLTLEKDLALLDVLEIFLCHGQEAAVVWDPVNYEFSGVVTDRDLLEMIISQYHEDDMELEEMQIISRLRGTSLDAWQKASQRSGLLYVSPDDNLLDATTRLKTHHLHRIPILDEKQNSVLGLLSMEAVLRFFVENYVADGNLFELPIRALELGTNKDIISISSDHSLVQALRTLCQYKLSSLPIINAGSVQGILFLSDIPNIIRSGLYLNPQMPVLQAIRQLNDGDEMGLDRIGQMTESDTMRSMIQKLATCRERKLFRIDENGVNLIITESDLFSYFL
jgi:CBS domain-containing protein